MKKYGFVYLWFDKKRKMYYVGCHWGTENDGYICSSDRMRDAYRRRPDDFKRRIIEMINDKSLLYDVEYKWLSLISEEDLGKKYYNLRKHKWGHWTTDLNSSLTIREKISKNTKEAMNRSDVREKYLKGLENRDNRSSDPLVREKRSRSMSGKNKGKITVRDALDNVFHVTSDDPRWISGEVVSASKGIKRSPISESHRQKIKEAGVFASINNKKVSCVHCGIIGNPGNIGRYHNDRCKSK
jgi:hypothetical protein